MLFAAIFLSALGLLFLMQCIRTSERLSVWGLLVRALVLALLAWAAIVCWDWALQKPEIKR